MPDRNSLTFWKDVAEIYKDHPAVLFDLYNEPHDVSWDVWLKGGKVTEKNRRGANDDLRGRRDAGAAGRRASHRGEECRHHRRAGLAYDFSGILEGGSSTTPTATG